MVVHFGQMTAYEVRLSLVGSEMCLNNRHSTACTKRGQHLSRRPIYMLLLHERRLLAVEGICNVWYNVTLMPAVSSSSSSSCSNRLGYSSGGSGGGCHRRGWWPLLFLLLLSSSRLLL